MALKLKRNLGVPWVMHLSDPWADCPERNYRGISKTVQDKLELECFQTADVICVTSEKTRAFYAKKYAKLNLRIEYFPNVFDLEDSSTPTAIRLKSSEDRKLRIVHTGSLIGMRSVGLFLKAVSQVPSEIQERLEVLFVGPVDSANFAEFKRWSLPCVRVEGQVDYKASLEIQRSADLLLMIDFTINDPQLRMFFPSKMLDYILAERPILALSSEGSEIQEVVRTQHIGKCIAPDKTREVAEYLTSFAMDEKREHYLPLIDTREIYSAQHNAKRLVRLFRDELEVRQMSTASTRDLGAFH